jgi:RNA polymerase sigma factor (sigma-70 family)
MDDDFELLRQYAKTRSEEFFAEYVRRNIGLVYAAALRATNGDAHAAADVTQTVFLAVARGSSRLAEHPAPLSWLFVTTRNAARSFMRGEHTRRKYEQAAAAAASATGTTPALGWAQVRPLLDDAIEELNEKEREAILLRFFENCPFGEIGRRLCLSDNAARMRVERALARLHGLLARRGVSSTAAALGGTIAANVHATVPAGLAAQVTATAFIAGPASAAATFLTFMNMSKSIVAVGSAITALSVSVSVYQWNRACAAQDSMAAAVAAQQAAARDLVRLGAQLNSAEEKLASTTRAPLCDWLDSVDHP